MLISIVVVVGIVAAWRFGFWPFSRSFKYLPSYGQICRNKADAAGRPAPETPVRPSL